MHLKPRFLNILINILLGAAWAVAFYGFLSGFLLTNSNIFIKLLNAILHASIGLFAVLLLEAIYTIFKIREHQIKQSQDKNQ